MNACQKILAVELQLELNYNLKKTFYFKYILDKHFLLFFDKVKNILYFYNGAVKYKIRLPNFYLNKNLYFLFFDKYKYKSFLNSFIDKYKKSYKFFFFKMKLKGLGYKIFPINRYLIKFFFGNKCYVYLHIPNEIFYSRFKKKRRTMFFFSINIDKLNNFLKYVINMRKIDFYERNNMFITKKPIIYFKKRK